MYWPSLGGGRRRRNDKYYTEVIGLGSNAAVAEVVEPRYSVRRPSSAQRHRSSNVDTEIRIPGITVTRVESQNPLLGIGTTTTSTAAATTSVPREEIAIVVPAHHRSRRHRPLSVSLPLRPQPLPVALPIALPAAQPIRPLISYPRIPPPAPPLAIPPPQPAPVFVQAAPTPALPHAPEPPRYSVFLNDTNASPFLTEHGHESRNETEAAVEAIAERRPQRPSSIDYTAKLAELTQRERLLQAELDRERKREREAREARDRALWPPSPPLTPQRGGSGGGGGGSAAGAASATGRSQHSSGGGSVTSGSDEGRSRHRHAHRHRTEYRRSRSRRSELDRDYARRDRAVSGARSEGLFERSDSEAEAEAEADRSRSRAGPRRIEQFDRGEKLVYSVRDRGGKVRSYYV